MFAVCQPCGCGASNRGLKRAEAGRQGTEILLEQASGPNGRHRPSAGWFGWRLQHLDPAAATATAAGHATIRLSTRVRGFTIRTCFVECDGAGSAASVQVGACQWMYTI